MLIRKLLLVATAGALLLLPLANCMAAAQNEAAMRCCVSMPCMPTQRGSACCQTTPATPGQMMPAARVSLQARTIALATHVRMPDIRLAAAAPLVAVAASQHSPPELYTLHACLLI
jgi:hypothetical protein